MVMDTITQVVDQWSVDNKLNFNEDVESLCKKANSKLRALARVTPFINVEKQRLVINSFFNAQSNYCPLIWTLHSHTNDNMIRHLPERCLRSMFDNKQSTYDELLRRDNLVSVPIEIYKVWLLKCLKLRMKGV